LNEGFNKVLASFEVKRGQNSKKEASGKDEASEEAVIEEGEPVASTETEQEDQAQPPPQEDADDGNLEALTQEVSAVVQFRARALATKRKRSAICIQRFYKEWLQSKTAKRNQTLANSPFSKPTHDVEFQSATFCNICCVSSEHHLEVLTFQFTTQRSRMLTLSMCKNFFLVNKSIKA
jgi:hypothetical protein